MLRGFRWVKGFVITTKFRYLFYKILLTILIKGQQHILVPSILFQIVSTPILDEEEGGASLVI